MKESNDKETKLLIIPGIPIMLTINHYDPIFQFFPSNAMLTK